MLRLKKTPNPPKLQEDPYTINRSIINYLLLPVRVKVLWSGFPRGWERITSYHFLE